MSALLALTTGFEGDRKTDMPSIYRRAISFTTEVVAYLLLGVRKVTALNGREGISTQRRWRGKDAERAARSGDLAGTEKRGT